MKIKLTQPQPFYLALLFSLLVALSLPGTVFAHLDLKRSDPESGEIFDEPPKFVQLWFNEELDTFESSIAVFDFNGIQVDLGNSQVNPEDRTEMRVSLPNNQSPGVYTIKWVAVDDKDGHPIEGEIQYTIKGSVPQPDQLIIFSPTSVIYLILLVGAVLVSVLLYHQRKQN